MIHKWHIFVKTIICLGCKLSPVWLSMCWVVKVKYSTPINFYLKKIIVIRTYFIIIPTTLGANSFNTQLSKFYGPFAFLIALRLQYLRFAFHYLVSNDYSTQMGDGEEVEPTMTMPSGENNIKDAFGRVMINRTRPAPCTKEIHLYQLTPERERNEQSRSTSSHCEPWVASSGVM